MELDRSTTPQQLRWYLDGVNFYSINAGQVSAATWRDAITARAILDSNANRHGSGSWEIGDDTMREILGRAEPQLIALFGDMDTPRDFNRTFELLIVSPNAARGGSP